MADCCSAAAKRRLAPRAELPELSDERKRRAAEHQRAHRVARSETARDLLRTCAQMVAFVLAGWVLIGFSLHTTDAVLGRSLWLIGLIVWIPGVLFTLLGFYKRGEQRGDW